MNKMLKKEMLEELSESTKLSMGDCEKVLSALAKLIAKKTLDEDTAVAVSNLGTFSPNHKKARTARNPRTGEAVQVASKTVIKFKSHSNLVNENEN